MAIQRSGPTPTFLEYIIGNAVIPKSGPPANELLTLTANDFQWIDVPSYQRGIAWDVNTIDELTTSDSVLLGNVILGQFNVSEPIKHLPEHINNFSVLVDGLQRFSVGTIILTILHPIVLNDDPLQSDDAPFFSSISARCKPFSVIYLYNDKELSNHPRQAISRSYRTLKDSLSRYVNQRFDRGEGRQIAEEIRNLFLNKQIAVDIYFNFNNPLELMNTFLGINTVRVDLGPVDLLRSYIVEKASRSNWRPAEVEAMENRFTDVFTINDKPKTDLLPCVSIFLKAIADKALDATTVFPSWNGDLERSEVDLFLEFIEEFLDCNGNGYVNEIRNSGAIPYACIIAYYYKKLVFETKTKPSFFGGLCDEDAELHPFLCSIYRVLLEGKIGRMRIYAERILFNNGDSLRDAADVISKSFVGCGIDTDVDPSWLTTVIKRGDKKKAARIFNALRLPKKILGWGQAYSPDVYGSKSKQYHVDHLIPASIIEENQKGAMEAQSLQNFAPLTSNQNIAAKATSCSAKLSGGGIYSNYISANPSPHPYCEWLVNTQGFLGSQLDMQELLEPNSSPNVGNERIEWIVSMLMERI